MKSTRSWTAAIAGLALLAILIPAAVHSQPAPPPPSSGGPAWARGGDNAPGGFFRQALIAKLDLSEEQQTKLGALRLKHQQEQTRLSGEVANAKAELEALLLDPEADRNAVLKAGAKVQDLRSKMATARLAHQMDMRALLTAEQRAEWVQMRAERPHRGAWGMRGGARRMGDRGPHARHRGPRTDG